MVPKYIKGSHTIVYSPNGAIGTKHTISHTILFNEFDFKDAGYETCFKLEKVACPVFTAQDDGEVYFQVRFRKTSADLLWISLSLVSKPLPLTVKFYCTKTADINMPFNNMAEGVPYKTTVVPNEMNGSVDLSFFRKEYYEGFRIDVTYIKVPQVNKQPTVIKPNNNEAQPKRSLGADLLCLLNNPAASDVTLKSNEQEWKVQKCVLMARSDVFAAMFASDMKENQDGIVEINDSDSKALDLMIKFIYTDAIHDIDAMDQKTTEELLVLADKYNLPVLKEKCERILISQLSVGNCLRLCVLARKYNSELLLAPSKIILAENFERIGTEQTEDFKDFVRDDPDLHIDILRIKLSNMK